MEQPTGVITFLFTDIEGSTRLWDSQPEQMRVALEEHDRILRDEITKQGGVVFKTVGDAFCAAFGDPLAALQAALNAQRGLTATRWPDEIRGIHVRMGLHTGPADERDEDYFGPTLNRVARIEAAGHGGQVLVSLATAELVRDSLPDGVTLQDMGSHRLKDLLRHEQLFQASAPDLIAEFPPLRTLNASLNNLPTQLTPLIGRERELTAVLGLLRRDDVRLVTLIGPGGTGKTRLSQQAAAELLDEYTDGVWFVDLSPIADPDFVASSVAAALGVKEVGSEPILDTLKTALQNKQMLLVLDNFEQVIPAAGMVGELLDEAAQVKLVVTSREVLNLYGEHVYPVPPLGLPEIGQLGQTAAILSQYEAVRLFVERAHAANPSFDISEDNASTIAEICLRLDGLPLAIELAAARSRLMTPDTIRGQLGERLKVLTGGARNRPARQQTLRGAIDWSFDLLDSEEQRLFTRLGIFAGGWTPEAADAVCGDDLDIDVFAGLEALLDKSLIRQTSSWTGAPRFTMLETIREYALERLQASGEADSIARKHVVYFTGATQQIREAVFTGGAMLELLEWSEEEHNNYRAVLDWCLEPGESGPRDLDSAALVISNLFQNWIGRGRVQEGHTWVEKALVQAVGSETHSSTYGELLNASAALLAFMGGDIGLAGRRAAESLALWRELEEPWGLGIALLAVGAAAVMQDRFDEGERSLKEALELTRASGMIPIVASVLMRLSDLELARGDYDASDAYCQQVLELEENEGQVQLVINNALNNLGEAARCRGDYEAAARFYQAALDRYHGEGVSADVSRLLHNLAYVALHNGDIDRSRDNFRESLLIFQGRDSLRGVAECLNGLGAVALARGDAETCVTLMTASRGVFERLSALPWPADRLEVESRWQEAQQRLDPAAFAQEEMRGRTVSLEEAIELALEQPA